MIIGVGINLDCKAWDGKFGMVHFVNPKEAGEDIVPYLVNMTKYNDDSIRNTDYTFDCTGWTSSSVARDRIDVPKIVDWYDGR